MVSGVPLSRISEAHLFRLADDRKGSWLDFISLGVELPDLDRNPDLILFEANNNPSSVRSAAFSASVVEMSPAVRAEAAGGGPVDGSGSSPGS